MLPTGHVAAGFLTAVVAVKIFKPELVLTEIYQLYAWGMLFGFIPDLDEFWFFFKTKGFLVSPKSDQHHRKFFTHTPVTWLVLGGLVYWLAPNEYWKLVGVILVLGTWSHFFLDSIEYGIMWLWPFKNELYAFKNKGSKLAIEEKNFFKHSILFLKISSTSISELIFELSRILCKDNNIDFIF
jgi:membrane-bound metal-dependent hydrolase YbcI (DUF457 family)